MPRRSKDLLDALEDVDDATREEASKALGELADPATLDALIGACGDEYWTVRPMLVGSARIGGPKAVEALIVPVQRFDHGGAERSCGRYGLNGGHGR